MGKVQPLHPTDPAPFPSAQRATLAALIDAGNVAKRAEGEARTALDRATQKVTETKAQLAEAQWNVSLAKQAQATSAERSATTGSPLATTPSLTEARAREVEVQDMLDAASAAVVVLQAVVTKAQQVATRAAATIDGAARSVIAAEIPRLVNEARVVQADHIRRRLALKAIIMDLKISGPEVDDAERFMRNTDLPGTFGSVEYRQWYTQPAAQQWQRYLDALMTNADAALPELE
jgi:hypothetical protein